MKFAQPRATGVVIGLFLVGAALTLAQDVTVVPLTWTQPEDAPDELPVRKKALKPEFPEELRRTADIGYVTGELFVDERGQTLARQFHGTLLAYANAVDAAEERTGRADSKKFIPARRHGDPVNASLHASVIFNPASASTNGADATPRLLDVSVVVDPRRATKSHAPAVATEVVWAVASLDERGQLVALKDARADLAELLEAQARRWRFAPARRGGQPVAAEVRVPFVVVPPQVVSDRNHTPPRAIRRDPPVYPVAMRRSGWRGDVLVDFVVDIEGRVRLAAVVRSLNPGFNAAALEAVRGWKFEPGRVNGIPVNTHLQAPIRFELDGQAEGGGDGLEVRRRGKVSTLPPELRYDVAPKASALVMPKYPYDLWQKKVRGSAEVNLLVDAAGTVVMSKVTKADRPEFGFALQAAAELFVYRPALRDGQPCAAMIGFQQDFAPDNDALVPEAEQTALALERKHPERLLTAAQLDARLKPVITTAPLYPRSFIKDEDLVDGSAKVEFLVDEEGRVCGPRVIAATKPEFGFAAVQAVATWRFAPPASKGKPGVMRVVVPVEFQRPGAAEPKPAAP